MPTLHLGVVDVPHGAPSRGVRATLGRGKSKLKGTTTLTTGDLADILEARYHPMEIFFQVKQKRIAKELESGLAGALESMLTGGPATLDPFGSATSAIQNMFQDFLTNRELERLGYPGVPTRAALDGVNHRLLHPYAQANKRRPSLIDTGKYQASFRAWVD